MGEQTTSGQRQATPFPMAALLVLALTIFVNISVEMLPMGLVLPMSRDLSVSESAIGLLVSVFAFTVVASSTTLIRLTRRLPRHALVIGVLLIFTASCLATAVVPTYEWIVAMRIIGGLAHGVFWTVVGAYAAYLVPPEQLGRAVAITSAGGSLAFVLGLPLSTLLGQAVGWRWAFAVFGVACLLAALAVWKVLPPVDHMKDVATTETGSLALPVEGSRVSMSGMVVAILSTTLAMTGQYAFYTFIAPFLVQHAQLPEEWLSPALLAYGVMGAIAVLALTIWLGGRPLAGVVACMIVMLLTMVVLALSTVLPLTFAAILVWGLAMGALPPLLQTRLLEAAPERLLQPAMAWYTTGFNTGIGGGALLGAIAFDSWGPGSLPWVLFAGIAVSLALVAVSHVRRRNRA
ncbi:Predicted arabinose efflux permease, MFS family [Agrococcus baldri]|uniref:Predicted arabinose efflux permease, MFS family n=1 Tax=Agrococcus baldri TaxID=153730 RepID=A0AA94KYT4_9MICO|nr:MFS transporter [Agrococcus baldri]SFS01740.1 Predicted arabinose efflux permease, MFS family [Agrococcus baldri]